MDLNGFVNILLAEKQYVHSDVRGGGWCSAKTPRQGNAGLTRNRCADVCLGATGALRDGQGDAVAYALAAACVHGFWFLNFKTPLLVGMLRVLHTCSPRLRRALPLPALQGPEPVPGRWSAAAGTPWCRHGHQQPATGSGDESTLTA